MYPKGVKAVVCAVKIFNESARECSVVLKDSIVITRRRQREQYS